MTSGFEQQDTLANLACTRPVPRPHQVGVKLLAEPRPGQAPRMAPARQPPRPAEPRTF